MTTTARSIASRTASSIALAAALLAAATLANSQGKQSIGRRAEACFACHGAKGHSTTPLTPSIAGQPSFFVVAQLFLFRDNRRGKAPTPMYEAAKGLSDADLQAWGDFLARLPPPQPPKAAPDGARFERGRALAGQHNCANCHNADYSGREQMPRLANQREDYLLKALRDYKSGERLGYGMAVMPEAMSGLRDGDLMDVAHYLAHLPATKAKR
jgi:cytochrome c553